MRRRGFNQADAARFLEFGFDQISTLLSGKRSPGLQTAVHIERLTGISVEAWVPTELDEAPEPVTAGSRKAKSLQSDKAPR